MTELPRSARSRTWRSRRARRSTRSRSIACSSARARTRGSRTCARRRPSCAGGTSIRPCGARRPGLRAGEAGCGGRGPRPHLHGRRLRVAARRRPDVPRHESGRARSRRALRVDVEPQLRGPARRRRAHSPRQPDDRRGHRDRRSLRRGGRARGGAGMEQFRTVTSRALVLDRPDVDTDQIVPKQFLKRIERTGFGEFLFFDWRKIPTSSSTGRSCRCTHPPRRPELRLRLVARARSLGARGLRLRRSDRAVVR